MVLAPPSAPAPGSAVASDGRLDFDANAPLRVLKGSILTTAAGFAAGASYGVWKNQSGTLLGSRMAVNCFSFAFPFFAVRQQGMLCDAACKWRLSPGYVALASALREYVLGPVLASADPAFLTSLPAGMTYNTHSDRPQRPRPPDLLHNALASTLSGAAVGATLAGIRRGRASIASGAIVFGCLCGVSQLAGNEARRIAWRFKARNDADVAAHLGSASAEAGLFGGAQQRHLPPPNSIPAQQPAAPPREETRSWLSRLKGALPVQKISDSHYEQRLRERLARVEAELSELDAELNRVDRFEKGEPKSGRI